MKEEQKKESNSYLDDVLKKYFIEAQKHYPNFRFGERFSMYSGSEPTSCELELKFSAKCTVGTEYEVPENSNLIHYTFSVQNVMEILNSGFLRLGNLLSVNDPQEMSFIAKNLRVSNFEPNVEGLRSTFFSASFCQVTDEEKPDDFPMWRLYGNDGRGAAIVFEIDNHEQDWASFILSQVQYGDGDAVDKYKKFIEFHKLFQEAHNYPFQNIPIVLIAFMALHKNKIWEYENEIRLLTHNDYDEYQLTNDPDNILEIRHSLSKDNKRYSFVELPLKGGTEYKRKEELNRLEFLYHTLPILKVKEIILGYRITSDNYMDINTVINSISNKYGYHMPIKLSHLKEYM